MHFIIPFAILNGEPGKSIFKGSFSEAEWIETEADTAFECVNGKTISPAIAVIEAHDCAEARKSFRGNSGVFVRLNDLPVLCGIVNLQSVEEIPICSDRRIFEEENTIFCTRKGRDCCLMATDPSFVCKLLSDNKKIQDWMNFARKAKSY